jgi:hypothetical protein
MTEEKKLKEYLVILSIELLDTKCNLLVLDIQSQCADQKL